MLSRLIISSFETLIEVALWVLLLVGVLGGYNTYGVGGAVLGLIAWFLLSVVIFGVVLVLTDIHRHVQFLASSRIQPNPKTHVLCPDCKSFIPKQAKVCSYCRCNLVPEA